ncbi:MAG: hypothetical protein H0U04_09190 [Rubrobacter sp.]|nr:hypothetical protein [Rubrobacter sp.]
MKATHGVPLRGARSLGLGRAPTRTAKRRRSAAIASVLALAALSVPLTPATSYAKSCYAYELIDYNRGRLYAEYLIDLPSCWAGTGEYKVRAKIVRQVGPDTEIVKKVKTCAADDLCRIPLVMNHEELEVAQYTVSLRYRVRENTSVIQRKEMLCASASVFESRCEEL